MKKIILCAAMIIIALAFPSCSNRHDTTSNGVPYYAIEYIEAVHIEEPEASPAPPAPLEPQASPAPPAPLEPVSAPAVRSCPSGLFSLTGVITDFCGPVSEYGIVPWDVEWFTFEIEKTDGTPAIIAGVHTTAFIFGSKPQIGMSISAYVAYDFPVFGNDPPLYIATAIVTGFSPEQNFIVCCDFSDEEFSYISNNATEYIHVVNERLWGDGSSWRSFFHLAVMYSTTEDGLPVAHTIFPFNNKEFFGWSYLEPPQETSLNFTNYVFPADAFEVVDLPIFINGKEINSVPPILVDDIIMVPLREAMQASIAIREFTSLTDDGNLDFIGGGGGSEDSYWRIGRASVGFISSRHANMSLPPIIVGGIVYVPYTAICGVPFACAWRFDNRIEFFHHDSFPYGTWLEYCHENREYLISDEELASFPIIFNGVEIASGGAILDRDWWRDIILVPLTVIAEALGYSIIQNDEHIYFSISGMEDIRIWSHTMDDKMYVGLYDLFRNLRIRSFIYDGQILMAQFS